MTRRDDLLVLVALVACFARISLACEKVESMTDMRAERRSLWLLSVDQYYREDRPPTIPAYFVNDDYSTPTAVHTILSTASLHFRRPSGLPMPWTLG